MNLTSAHSQRVNPLGHLFRGYKGPGFLVRLPGNIWEVGAGEPAFAIVLKNEKSLHRLFHAPSELKLAEGFISGDIDVEGDIFAALDAVETLFSSAASWTNTVMLARRAWLSAVDWATRGARHSRRRDASSIAYHYDLPPAFYAPWLGPTLLYSAAYFRNASEDLDTAQINKLDLICRKLSLQKGDRFLDVGCGWGSLLMRATSAFGVTAHGVTISQQQAEFAARRIANAHIGDACVVERRDYRDIAGLRLPFDKAASIGMFEHVGLKNMRRYFRTVYQALQPGGLFLNAGIVRSTTSPPRKGSFIDRYVFPDGELPTLPFALQQAEAVGFEVRDVENLREHYALTLRMWVSNLQRESARLLGTVSDRILRIWLLYMAGSAVAFERGDIGVCQILLRRPAAHQPKAPSTRERWYQAFNSTSRNVAA